MSEITVGWFNAAKAYDPGNPEVQSDALRAIGSLPVRLDVLGVGEFTGPDVSEADLATLGERFGEIGYRFSAVDGNTRRLGERNAHTIALFTGQQLVGAQIAKYQFGGLRNGYAVTTADGITVEAVHAPDDDEAKRIPTLRGMVGVLGVIAHLAAKVSMLQDVAITRSVAMADFNGVSRKDKSPGAHILRGLSWVDRHTPLKNVQFDYYKPNRVTRPLGLLLRAIRMADGSSRSLLEDADMQLANQRFAATCFHLGGLLKLSLDGIYASSDGEFVEFTQYVPLAADGSRLSDHNIQVARIRFPD